MGKLFQLWQGSLGVILLCPSPTTPEERYPSLILTAVQARLLLKIISDIAAISTTAISDCTTFSRDITTPKPAALLMRVF